MTKYFCLLIGFFIISCSDKSTHDLEPILESNLKMNKMMAEDCYYSNVRRLDNLIEDGGYQRGIILKKYKEILEDINDKYQTTTDSFDKISKVSSNIAKTHNIEEIYRDWIKFNRCYIPSKFDSLVDFNKYFANDFNKLMADDSIDFYESLRFAKKKKYPYNFCNLILKNKFIISFYSIQSYVSAISPHYNSCFNYEKYAFVATSDKGVIIRNGYAEITAGMGSFNDKNEPIIKINNQYVKINSDGVAEMKVKAPNKKGIFIIPVEFSITSQSGELKKFIKNIDVRVVDSICN